MKKKEEKKLTQSVQKIVIGDVGSGKTIVALTSGFCFLSGVKTGQVALIAPTEILANQHYKNLQDFLIWQGEKYKNYEENSINTILLSGKNILVNGVKITAGEWKNLWQQNTQKQEKILEKLGVKNQKNGTDFFKKIFWVGTHALFFENAVQPDLILADEQHRFGVRQRQKLSQNGRLFAHYISFTATPIPRTLALSTFGKLEPIFLEKLSTRNEINTEVLLDKNFEKDGILKIEKHVKMGKKVFVICPKVEDENEDLWSVGRMKKILEKKFKNQVLTTHGKEKEKSKTMLDFKNNDEKKILVATTVVEVGVDVSEATLCVVMNAEMFGLSTLHQIRGRVGRNKYEFNECLLVATNNLQNRRLQALCESQDGFYLAQKDMENRGSGDIFGTMQSGNGLTKNILNLEENEVLNLQNLVKNTDLNDPKLNRLKKYLEKKAENIWEE